MNRPIHVLGAGGIGVALAWCLVRNGRDVTLVEAHSGKVESGRNEGLTVVNQGTEHPPFVAFDDWIPPKDGIVLLCTQTYDNPAVLARLRNPDCLVPVQNGFDPELDQQGHAGEGIASFVSECLRNRPVTRITRPGCLHLGARRTVTATERADLASLAAALSVAGALFLILEMDQPFGGVIQISSEPMSSALSELGKSAVKISRCDLRRGWSVYPIV